MATLRRQLALRGRITRHVPKEHNLQHETRMNATFSDVRRKSAASCLVRTLAEPLSWMGVVTWSSRGEMIADSDMSLPIATPVPLPSLPM